MKLNELVKPAVVLMLGVGTLTAGNLQEQFEKLFSATADPMS